ncbi:MAG: LamG domain-containing protein [Verrucomicrobiae bacterium]|nr:LamG domain-containing protein [Verrucomicrobiae bacterium]
MHRSHISPPAATRITASVLLLALPAASGCSSTSDPSASRQALRRSLIFHASFDHGLDADVAAGPRGLSNAPSLQQRDAASAGLPSNGEVQLAPGAGRFGNALRFTRRESPLVFFSGERNAGYRKADWSGTVSFWLQVDPAAELAPGYCDPIQITPRAWNDAAFFVEFEKRTNDVPFRLGAYADFAVWNPLNRRWEDLPVTEKPVVAVAEPPFRAGRWTHVVFTFEHFNSGRDDGLARLYLDGTPAGSIGPRRQTYTWDEARSLIMLGVGYLGLWDELAIFDRALVPSEVAAIHALPNGIADLR